MKQFDCSTIAQAHEQIVRYIYWNHRIIETEDNEITWESDSITIVVRNPLSDKMIHSLSSFQKKKCDEYTNQLIYGSISDFDYTYHERLFEYKIDNSVVDQIQKIILHLSDECLTRRAIAITWNPSVDTSRTKSVPCLQFIQFLIRNNRLNLISLFRSEDVLQAFSANAYGIVKLQEYISKIINIPVGTYTHIITVPHLYSIRDVSELKKWC